MASAYANLAAARNPLHWWRMSELSGASVSDSGSSAVNGTAAAGVTLGRAGALFGDSNAAAAFSGNTAGITFPALISPAASSSRSVISWCRTTIAGRHGVIGTRGTAALGDSARGWFLGLRDGTDIAYVVSGIAVIQAAVNYPVGTWFQIGFSHDVATGAVSLVYNGAAVATVTAAMGTTPNSFNGVIGAEQSEETAESWIGDLDEVQVYDRVLSSAEFAADYAAGSGATLITARDIQQIAQGISGYIGSLPSIAGVLPSADIQQIAQAVRGWA